MAAGNRPSGREGDGMVAAEEKRGAAAIEERGHPEVDDAGPIPLVGKHQVAIVEVAAGRGEIESILGPGVGGRRRQGRANRRWSQGGAPLERRLPVEGNPEQGRGHRTLAAATIFTGGVSRWPWAGRAWIERTTFIPLTTLPNAANPCPSGLRLPPKSSSG